ncbi:MAG: hypothetical protein WCT85_00825 [Parachlamydiales bacterium]
MSTPRIYKLFLITLTLVAIHIIIPTKIFAGGGPQFYCKEMAVKQGWLIDVVRSDEELSKNACISRDPTSNEKDEILDFCKSEDKGDARTDCLDKCRKYYSDTVEFRRCDKNEALNTKATIYTNKIGEFLNSGKLLATVVITLATIALFYGVVSILKRFKRIKQEKD